MTTLVIYIIITLALSAFFSGMEIAFVGTNKLRFEMDRAQSGPATRIAAIFLRHPNNFISTLLVGNNIALVVYGILIARLLQPTLIQPMGITNEWLALLVQTLVSTAIVLVTGEFLPKMLFRLNPNRTLTFFAPLAFVFYVILYPLSKFTSIVAKLLLRIGGVKVSHNEADKVFSRIDLDDDDDDAPLPGDGDAIDYFKDAPKKPAASAASKPATAQETKPAPKPAPKPKVVKGKKTTFRIPND